MPITKKCERNSLNVQVNLAAKQRLRYTVSTESDIDWIIKDQDKATILEPPPASGVRYWPLDGDVTTSPRHHTLGLAMAGAASIRWRVELLAQDGTLIELVKDCTYKSAGEADEYFDALAVYT